MVGFLFFWRCGMSRSESRFLIGLTAVLIIVGLVKMLGGW